MNAQAAMMSCSDNSFITPESILAPNESLDNDDVATIDQVVQSTIAALPNAPRLLESS